MVLLDYISTKEKAAVEGRKHAGRVSQSVEQNQRLLE
ncbi:hypothetical protein Clst_0536 [Thermoclostridium stercorarium subsp. stercorarium DSM 8532]|jgi:hypothetical protein|nr:hypothetical protein Clst_0536 [Thermoclostridium stercorarium subsp. stercorarium DSM 8532]